MVTKRILTELECHCKGGWRGIDKIRGSSQGELQGINKTCTSSKDTDKKASLYTFRNEEK